MKTRKLGHSGLRVSEYSLGSWLTIGASVDDPTSFALLDCAFARGVTLFDTADIYNFGQAELAIGKWLQTIDRNHVVIATKAFFQMSDHWMDQGLSQRYLVNACLASLERLGIGTIDLYQCHRYDIDTPLEETCFTMNWLIDQGYISYWGVSQWSAVQITNAMRICERHGWRKPISNQPIYNLLNRSLEVDVLGVTEAEGMGNIVYSPLAQGILTGKYSSTDQLPAGSRAANPEINQYFSFKRLNDDTFAKLEALRQVAAQLGCSLTQLALAWCLRVRPVSSVILGASSVEQLNENLDAQKVEMSGAVQAQIESILANAPVDQYSGARIGYGV